MQGRIDDFGLIWEPTSKIGDGWRLSALSLNFKFDHQQFAKQAVPVHSRLLNQNVLDPAGIVRQTALLELIANVIDLVGTSRRLITVHSVLYIHGMHIPMSSYSIKSVLSAPLNSAFHDPTRDFAGLDLKQPNSSSLAIG